ncbi:MAG: DUF3592 domain-containing protein [Acidobacteriaceae bacterium]|nr:DUF3592 domain-containing protein [Acidobacteriaceae bacterium]
MPSTPQIVWTSRGFLWCGLATLAFGILFGVRRVIAIERWSAATGEVVQASLEYGTSVEGSDMWAAKISVRWRAGSQEIDRVFDQWGSSSDKGRYARIVDHYRVGSKTEVRYDPSKPANAYIEARYTPPFFLLPLLLGLGGSLFAALGFCIGLLPRRG